LVKKNEVTKLYTNDCFALAEQSRHIAMLSKLRSNKLRLVKLAYKTLQILAPNTGGN